MECGPDEPTGRANARPMTGSVKSGIGLTFVSRISLGSSGLRLARRQFDIRCPLRVAAAAAAGMADEVAGVVHRTIQIEPGEVREQDEEGDPERCLGHSIHVSTRKSSQSMSGSAGEKRFVINRHNRRVGDRCHVRVVGNWHSDNEWDEPVNLYYGARNGLLTILVLAGLDDVTKPALRVRKTLPVTKTRRRVKDTFS
jgi:hypothetical protein